MDQGAKLNLESVLVAAGRPGQPGTPLNTPLVAASNFLYGEGRGYTRGDGNPTWEALEAVVGELESGRALAFSCGMAAIAAVFDQLHCGAHVLVPADCYQGVAELADDGAGKGRWTVERLATEDTQGWIRASSDADLIWLESPSNPLLVVADLPAICAAPRKPDAIVAVDNTFATPLNQQPLALGATISIQSATKFIGGHSDLLCGVATTRDERAFAGLKHSRDYAGATPGALEAFLAVRGIRTLALRLRQSQHNAQGLAEWLSRHPRVTTVRYPGLPAHPTHEVAKRVLQGFGSMISFDLDGSAEDADRLCQRLRLIRHATSLGAVESIIERRAALTGQQHLPPSLLRLSVGIEHLDDLKADLEQALR